MNKEYRLINKDQLFKAEHEDKGTWYFTSSTKLMSYTECSYASFYMCVKGAVKQTKGWKITIVDRINISENQIDPQL